MLSDLVLVFESTSRLRMTYKEHMRQRSFQCFSCYPNNQYQHHSRIIRPDLYARSSVQLQLHHDKTGIKVKHNVELDKTNRE